MTYKEMVRYKNENQIFDEGDRVRILNTSFGAGSCIGGIGYVTDLKSTHGCNSILPGYYILSDRSEGYHVCIGSKVWNLGSKGKLELIPNVKRIYEDNIKELKEENKKLKEQLNDKVNS